EDVLLDVSQHQRGYGHRVTTSSALVSRIATWIVSPARTTPNAWSPAGTGPGRVAAATLPAISNLAARTSSRPVRVSIHAIQNRVPSWRTRGARPDGESWRDTSP